MKYDIKKLTLDEKIQLLTGKDLWTLENANGKLKTLRVADGPDGLCLYISETEMIPATAMPNLSVVANTWNTKMSKLDGMTIADECVENNVDVLLAPSVNIKRTPLGGRNFEYLSEDPYLAGVMAKEFIEGVQGKGVGTSVKHFCANNREQNRLISSSEVDERTLNEIYFVPFEIALSASPWTVMCSYNPVNGVYASENKKLLKDTLRDKLGFDGVIVSDWGSVHNPYKAHKASLDLQMSHSDESFGNIKDALNKGLITEKEIDYCVNNILTLIEKSENKDKKVEFTRLQRHENAVEIAKEGIVLLKNQDGILPIKKGTVNVSGEMAFKPILGGGGSAFVNCGFDLKPLVSVLNDKCKDAHFNQVAYSQKDLSVVPRPSYYEIENSDVAIICVRESNSEAENFDRTSLRLSPADEQYILTASKLNENVIVCVYAGSAVDMSAWKDKVKGIIYVGLCGEAVNDALASIIVGETCPSGKLAETFPLSLDDTFTKGGFGNGLVEWYNDGIFVGYRHYDRENLEVAYPFGYGLSYANFIYSNLSVKKITETDYEISYDVKNDSDIDAKEISELYVKDTFSMVVRPEKELKAFSKDLIKAGETKRITLKLDYRSFAYYSTSLDRWHVENGKFEILVGSSSRDIRLKTAIDVRLDDNTQQSNSAEMIY